MADRRAELERKKKQLAELRAKKTGQPALQTHTLDSLQHSSLSSQRTIDADSLIESLGIKIRDASPATRLSNDICGKSDANNIHIINRRPKANLNVVKLQTTSIPPKESVTYNKETQTAASGNEREYDSPSTTNKKAQPFHDYYVIHWDEEWEDEFPVLTYDDTGLDEDAEGSSLNFGTPPQSIRQKARHAVQREQSTGSGLPVVEMVKPAQTQQDNQIENQSKEKAAKQRVELSDDEKLQVMMGGSFRSFFDRATRITERAIYSSEPTEIFNDYAGNRTDLDSEDKRGAKLSFSRYFFDDKWSRNRCVTSFDWNAQYPELLLTSYNNNEESPNDPDGVCLVWNQKFKKKTPEYVFNCQSPVMAASFAKFHPNLVVGGTYSGQMVLWDNRSHKRTPVQRSPLSAAAHTHPIYCIQVVGTQNAHNVITISTDGKLCSWSLDMLSAPQETMELNQQKQPRPVAVTCVSFPQSDFNNFIIGSEEGSIYASSRHGSKGGNNEGPGIVFEGHQGPVTSVHCHPVQSQIDFSHLFLSSSIDWTVKLWSTKEKYPIHSFEDNNDYLYDVKWSPTHPALFATADGMGRIDLWNLNNDTELPTASTTIEGNPALNKITWNPSGNQIIAGDDHGKVWVYDVGEQVAVARGDESTQLLHTLQELKHNNLESSDGNQDVDQAYSSMSSTTMSSFTSPLR